MEMTRGNSSKNDDNRRRPKWKTGGADTGSEGGEGASSRKKRKNEVRQDNRAANNERRWEAMYQRLKQYKEEHGDANVPNRYHRNPQLGSWVSAQRRAYKTILPSAAESTAMTTERMAKLSELSFEWEATNPKNVPWEHRYNELLEFVKKHGHANVPMRWKENVQLSNWVSKQRHDYKLLQRGTSSRLTERRMKLLNDVNFVWEIERCNPRTQQSPERQPVAARVPTQKSSTATVRNASTLLNFYQKVNKSLPKLPPALDSRMPASLQHNEITNRSASGALRVNTQRPVISNQRAPTQTTSKARSDTTELQLNRTEISQDSDVSSRQASDDDNIASSQQQMQHSAYMLPIFGLMPTHQELIQNALPILFGNASRAAVRNSTGNDQLFDISSLAAALQPTDIQIDQNFQLATSLALYAFMQGQQHQHQHQQLNNCPQTLATILRNNNAPQATNNTIAAALGAARSTQPQHFHFASLLASLGGADPPLLANLNTLTNVGIGVSNPLLAPDALPSLATVLSQLYPSSLYSALSAIASSQPNPPSQEEPINTINGQDARRRARDDNQQKHSAEDIDRAHINNAPPSYLP